MAKDDFTFNENEWFTPKTYDSNYKYPPQTPGVYLWVNLIFNHKKNAIDYEILYVGSTNNLARRYLHHEKRSVFRQLYGNNLRFYFQENDDYYETEKRLIKETEARFNVQWR